MEQEFINVDEYLKNPKYDTLPQRQKELHDKIYGELPKYFPQAFTKDGKMKEDFEI